MRTSRACCIAVMVVFALSIPAREVTAHSLPSRAANGPQAVIDAVNALRSGQGLPPYSVNSILMSTAQDQANFMASTGSVQHTGPGGITVTNRLLNAGYPLAGDLSLGGFRSENIVGSPGMTAEAAVEAWTGDDVHLHTMLSADLTEIGAGVAEADGVSYYVIDCARPLSAGEMAAYTPGVEAAFSGSGDIIVPVSISTPDAGGNVYHEVQAGQSLWQIAYAYGVHIVDIQRLNGLGNNIVILLGQKLLIKRVDTPTPGPPTPIATLTPAPAPDTSTPPPTLAAGAQITPTQLAVPTPTLAVIDNSFGAGTVVGGIAIAALLGAALVAWGGRSRPTK